MTNGKSPEFEAEFEEESFREEGFEPIDEVIPFDAEEEDNLSTIFDGSETEDDDDSVLLMGPASDSLSQEFDIADITHSAEPLEDGDSITTSFKETKEGAHSHTNAPKKYGFNFGRFFMGIVLVFVGLVFLGQNMGWFDIVHFDLLSLWPIILIFLGLFMFNARKWWSKTLCFFAVLVVALFVVAALVGGSSIVGVSLTGNIIEEEREVTPFSRISLAGVGSMIIEEGDTESLLVRADETILNKIESSVMNGELILRFANPFLQFLFWNDVEIEYIVTVKDIDAITIDGAGSIKSLGITTDSLEVFIDGGGEVELDIDVQEFVARISGSGKYTMTGTADRQIIHISGSGKYFGKDVVSLETGIRISGDGEVEVLAEEELNVEITGSGSVRYLGKPFISNSLISGSGSIERLIEGVPDVLKDSSVLDKLKKIDEAEEFDIGILGT